MSSQSEAAIVEVLSSEEMDFHEGRRSVEVELRASGFEVEVELSEAEEPGGLLESLGAQATEDLVGRVAVLKLGKSGIAYVWLRGKNQLYRVTSSQSDPMQAANVLSLRVAELIALDGEGYDIEQSAPAKEPQSLPVAEERPPEQKAARSSLLAGLGAVFGAGQGKPLVDLRLAFHHRIFPHLGLELLAHSSLGRERRTFAEGDVLLSRRGLYFGPLYETGEHLYLHVGPVLGARCFGLRAEPSSGAPSLKSQLCTVAWGGLLRGGMRFKSVSAWLGGISTVGTRRIDVLSSNVTLIELEGLDAWFGGGVGWHY